MPVPKIQFIALGLRWLDKGRTTPVAIADIELHLRGSWADPFA